MNAEPKFVPYDTTTRPDAEVVHLIRRQNARRLAELNSRDDHRETTVLLTRALRAIRPEVA